MKRNDVWLRLLKEISKFNETQAQQGEGEARSNVTMSTLQLANLLPYVAIKSFSRPIFPGQESRFHRILVAAHPQPLVR